MIKKITFILLSTFLFGENEDALIKDIEQSLMAPCCWSGTVYDHGHSQMESEIAAFVQQGKTKKDILDYYVQKYGERILAVPVASGFNLFAWIAPVLMGIVGIFIISIYLKTSKTEIVLPSKKNAAIPHNSIIEKELKELD